MRELRFRAWVKPENCYMGAWQEDKTPTTFTVLNEVCECYRDGELIVEQYTGLKDKNGKEIYEGDIVKRTGRVAKNKCSIYKVVWDNFVTCFDLSPLERNKADIGYLNKPEMETRYEVIGNIHENPELLEGAK